MRVCVGDFFSTKNIHALSVTNMVQNDIRQNGKILGIASFKFAIASYRLQAEKNVSSFEYCRKDGN